MTREESKICAIDTVEAINMGKYDDKEKKTHYIDRDVALMNERTKLYREEPLYVTRPKEDKNAKITFSNRTTTLAMKRLSDMAKTNHYKVCALNFASAKHPGGGFLRGAMAQEESIARVSTLYASLLTCPEFYNYNSSLRSSLYSHYMIYSEGVTVFKDDFGEYLSEPYNVDIITCPAPNASAIRAHELLNVPKINERMEERIRRIIKVAILNNTDYLILGAFGCGVFGNSLEDVMEIFSKVLIEEDYQAYFKEIEFAIYDKDPKTYMLAKKYFEEE